MQPIDSTALAPGRLVLDTDSLFFVGNKNGTDPQCSNYSSQQRKSIQVFGVLIVRLLRINLTTNLTAWKRL